MIGKALVLLVLGVVWFAAVRGALERLRPDAAPMCSDSLEIARQLNAALLGDNLVLRDSIATLHRVHNGQMLQLWQIIETQENR